MKSKMYRKPNFIIHFECNMYRKSGNSIHIESLKLSKTEKSNIEIKHERGKND